MLGDGKGRVRWKISQGDWSSFLLLPLNEENTKDNALQIVM